VGSERSLRCAMQGHDVAAHVLACFGGAGGQHACAIARSLGMRTIFVHRFSGVLSAVGIALADVVAEAQEPAAVPLSSASLPLLQERLGALQGQAADKLAVQVASLTVTRNRLIRH
jgi:5-oxoprolinase (ATP-hydrolysing)